MQQLSDCKLSLSEQVKQPQPATGLLNFEEQHAKKKQLSVMK